MTLYDILGVLPTASQSEIKLAWRELVLKNHPDKSTPSTNASSPVSQIDIHLLTSAYEILRSDHKREAYDRELADSTRKGHSSGLTATYTTPTPPPPLARTTLSLEDFTPHYASSQPLFSASQPDEAESSEEDDPSHYTHPCRCGFEFLIRREDLEDGVDVVGCDGCGDWVGVGYEVVEDEDEEGDGEEGQGA